MALKIPGFEYEVKKLKRGQEIETLTIVLYAPDGSIFKLPWGGHPSTYLLKGYKEKPDSEWAAANKIYEAEKAAGLKRSDFQREIKNREVAAQMQADDIKLENSMQELDRQMLEREEKLAVEAKALDLPEKKKPGRPKKVK